MATATTTVRGVAPGTKLRVGSLIMAIGGVGFIGTRSSSSSTTSPASSKSGSVEAK